MLHERKCSFPKSQFEHISRNNVIFFFEIFWFIAPIRTSFSSLSRISYIQLKLQTSSRRCLSGSSSCIIRSFSALILSSRRCCAAYNFKTTLLFNVFSSRQQKKENAKRQNYVCPPLAFGSVTVSRDFPQARGDFSQL